MVLRYFKVSLRWLNRVFWPRKEWVRKMARALNGNKLQTKHDNVSAIEVKK